MNLAEHYDSAGDYLPEGRHDVTVQSFRQFAFNSGSPGVEFRLTDGKGRGAKLSFCVVEKALWVLADFAKACGVSQEDARNFSYDMLLNRRVNVEIEKNEKGYHEVAERSWRAVEGDTPPTVDPPRPEPVASSAPPVHNDLPF